MATRCNFFVSAVTPIDCNNQQLEQITLTPIIEPSLLGTNNWTMPLGSFVFLTNQLGQYTFRSQWSYDLSAIAANVGAAAGAGGVLAGSRLSQHP